MDRFYILTKSGSYFLSSAITGCCFKVNPPVPEQRTLEEKKYLSCRILLLFNPFYE